MGAVAVFNDFEKVSAFCVFGRHQPPIINDEHVDLGEAFEQRLEAAVGVRQCQLLEE